MKKALLLIFLSLFLSGCAVNRLTTTTTEFKQHPRTTIRTIDSDKNYQAVYEAVYTHMRDCWRGGLLLITCDVSGTIYSELRKAEITLTSLPGGWIFDIIEIQGIGEGSTIKAYLNPARCWNEGTPDENIEKIIKWIDGYYLCD